MNRIVAVNAGATATLSRLRHAVARIEGQETDIEAGARRGVARAFDLGLPGVDAVLRGGLAPASLHEVVPETGRDAGAATGFALALAIRAAARRDVLWIQTDFAGLEAGRLYAPGCGGFGLPVHRLLMLNVPRPVDALWAMEEALKCRALSGVVAELPEDAPLADLTATRRLTLAARAGGGFGVLLRHRASPLTSSAETRWQVAAAPGRPDRFGGLGRGVFALSLVKNRRGPTGRWTVTWDHHACVFSTLSLGVAQAAVDRPDRTPLARAG